jgi:hypothetical protein
MTDQWLNQTYREEINFEMERELHLNNSNK